ncbi:hypothetical protein phiK7A1_151 [Pseudomonas phage phiK7A1]|uniref:Uncharacterized protein n=1 Tax=Pseudomonas phage phiK7A1 TaxID=2759194 RepID=A0A7H0XFZ9_9CAUD|nr:hypothetical protein phiK7A1_151 [Pseudomonas phage phiK7A1]
MAIPAGVKVGDVLVAVDTVGNNIGDIYPAGREFRVCRMDGDRYLALEPTDYSDCDIWFYFFDSYSEVDNTDRFVIQQ